MPVVQKAKSSKKRLHQVQRVHDELAGGGNAPSRLPESGPASGSITRCPHGKLNEAYCRLTGGGC